MPERVSMVNKAHQEIAAVLNKGDYAVDLTIGNGHDTLFLAQCVGRAGKIYGFDIQQQAIDNTRERLSAYLSSPAPKDLDNIQLIKDCHSKLESYLKSDAGKIQAAMLNLGYLPGADKKIITQANTTILALEALVQLLAPGARISILAYPGHQGGDTETRFVENFCASLDKTTFRYQKLALDSTQSAAPVLFLVDKLINQ